MRGVWCCTQETAPALVEELVPDHLSIGSIQKVLKRLLRESIPIRDLVTILEALADHVDAIDREETRLGLPVGHRLPVREAVSRTGDRIAGDVGTREWLGSCRNLIGSDQLDLGVADLPHQIGLVIRQAAHDRPIVGPVDDAIIVLQPMRKCEADRIGFQIDHFGVAQRRTEGRTELE